MATRSLIMDSAAFTVMSLFGPELLRLALRAAGARQKNGGIHVANASADHKNVI